VLGLLIYGHVARRGAHLEHGAFPRGFGFVPIRSHQQDNPQFPYFVALLRLASARITQLYTHELGSEVDVSPHIRNIHLMVIGLELGKTISAHCDSISFPGGLDFARRV